jgi:hypothetical protein
MGYNKPATATRLAFFLKQACNVSSSSLTSTVDMRRRRTLPNLVEAFNLQKIHRKLEFYFALGFLFFEDGNHSHRGVFF